MRTIKRVAAVVGAGTTLSLALAAPAMAGGTTSCTTQCNPCACYCCPCPPPPQHCKPGYGFGDKNHCHFGPPGQGYSQSNPY